MLPMGAPTADARSGNRNANRIQKTILSMEEGCPHNKKKNTLPVSSILDHVPIKCPSSGLPEAPFTHPVNSIHLTDHLFVLKQTFIVLLQHAEYLQTAGEMKMDKIWFPAHHNPSYNGHSSRQEGTVGDE